ncbi:MAG: hypothetical protein R3C44_16080 [Chloroflexota bacterium]
MGRRRAGFSATTAINRKDWGLEWNVALENRWIRLIVTSMCRIELELVQVAEEAPAISRLNFIDTYQNLLRRPMVQTERTPFRFLLKNPLICYINKANSLVMIQTDPFSTYIQSLPTTGNLTYFPAETFPMIHPIDWLTSHFAVGGFSPIRRLRGILTAHMTQIAAQWLTGTLTAGWKLHLCH